VLNIIAPNPKPSAESMPKSPKNQRIKQKQQERCLGRPRSSDIAGLASKSAMQFALAPREGGQAGSKNASSLRKWPPIRRLGVPQHAPTASFFVRI
jgi:hypothetical protein